MLEQGCQDAGLANIKAVSSCISMKDKPSRPQTFHHLVGINDDGGGPGTTNLLSSGVPGGLDVNVAVDEPGAAYTPVHQSQSPS